MPTTIAVEHLLDAILIRFPGFEFPNVPLPTYDTGRRGWYDVKACEGGFTVENGSEGNDVVVAVSRVLTAKEQPFASAGATMRLTVGIPCYGPCASAADALGMVAQQVVRGDRYPRRICVEAEIGFGDDRSVHKLYYAEAHSLGLYWVPDETVER